MVLFLFHSYGSLLFRPTLLVRGLHGKSEGPSAGGGKFAASGSGGGGLLSGVGAGNGNRVGGRASAEWKAEVTFGAFALCCYFLWC